MKINVPQSYQGMRPYFGDIHNHCGISYGHGTLEDAYANARLQLDFASVTGHAYWHDMPRDEERLRYLVAYHENGFARLAQQWDHVQEVTEQFHSDNRFVTFLSFEWHSMKYGDHCVYYDGARGPIIRANSLEELRHELRAHRAAGLRAMAIPHHIGYRRGWRGIDWDYFTEEFSPVVEMMSMHGCGEHDDGPRPYLHTMGPRETGSSVVAGLRRGYRFGLIGSTDHHSAHPGSHGHGRLAVWATGLDRRSIWEAIQARRTYALTGDRIELAFDICGSPMGAVVTPTPERVINVAVECGGPLDYAEVVRNGVVIHRENGSGRTVRSGDFSGIIEVSVGWGERGITTEWDVEIEIVDGTLDGVEPRFRGDDVVAPAEEDLAGGHFSRWERTDEHSVRFRTRTKANATTTTDGTQSMSLHVVGDDATRVRATFNGLSVDYALAELREGSRSGRLGGFVTPAFLLSRAVDDRETVAAITFVDERRRSAEPAAGDDWYYVRVRQKNDQWAWSSPIWVRRFDG